MKLYVILSIILCFSCTIHAQIINNDPIIEFGPQNLKMDEPFTISVVVPDVENRPSVTFPEIAGLEKRSKSATSTMNTVGGKQIVVQTISQQYFALKQGTYNIESFFITVNGVKIKSEELTVVYSPGTVSNPEGDGQEEAVVPESVNNGEDIFLAVGTNKKGVFIREGFALGMSLYVPENAPVQMDFYQVSTQLQAILKKLRPVGCWEENVGIEEIIKHRVTIGGRKYTAYNLYQAQFFPMTLQDIVFPSVTLDMLVGAVGKTGEGKVIKSFRSRAIKIAVKPLPPHPLKDQIAVGEYSLVERLSSKMVYPGESIRYLFRIEGRGNIAAIPMPEISTNSAFDFYPPDVSRIIKRSSQYVTGEKSFDYFVVPRQDGTFPLGRYFQWVFFNPKTAKYDTLISQKTLQVRGDDYKLGNISLHGSAGLYDNLERLDSSQEYFDFKQILKDVTNAVVILLLITMVWIFRK